MLQFPYFFHIWFDKFIHYLQGWHGLNHAVSAQLVQPRFQRLSPPAGQFICSLYTTCGRVRQRGTIGGLLWVYQKPATWCVVSIKAFILSMAFSCSRWRCFFYYFANRKSTTWGIYREYIIYVIANFNEGAVRASMRYHVVSCSTAQLLLYMYIYNM